ncbi:uncharacterized protein BX664DRAFT_158995 [Halteromyces radiatus]|uniref:uncharacterized protein n=1 Tax=Halteromyces radiatus TaxID=101107 RepID=UPI00221F96F9|nr:uncharacterized protein BX664DRAFT_158995 [Halteromyces radiatus]KAI8086508.1 hypothetical protein BX664DRAFT_158995 [Halteromyces radiatus]
MCNNKNNKKRGVYIYITVLTRLYLLEPGIVFLGPCEHNLFTCSTALIFSNWIALLYMVKTSFSCNGFSSPPLIKEAFKS